MAWTYSDWIEQSTDSARLTRLRQHISEVSAQIDASVAGDGYSRSTGDLRQYLADLHQQRQELEAKTNATGRGRPVAVATRTRRRR